MEEKNIYEVLQDVRYKMSVTDIKKSGYNGFAKFSYFELKDFLPLSTKLFKEVGITPVFSIGMDANGIEYAYLKLFRNNETITFSTPTAEPNGNNPIQNLGAKITYLRRYLYLMALDLVENDIVDAQEPSKEKDDKVYATSVQVKMITENKDKLIDVFKEKGIKNVGDIKKLSIEEASEIIKGLENA